MVTDIVPAGLTVLSGTPDNGTWNNPNWTIGTINSGEEFTLVLQASVDNLPFNSTVTSFTNTVSHTQDQTDNNFKADDLSETISVSNNEITVTKSTLPSPDGSYNTIGEKILYEIIVTNAGPNTVNFVNVSDSNADPGSISPVFVSNILPGQNATFTAEHTITSADLSAGQVVNTAIAQGELVNGFLLSDDSDDPSNSTNADANLDGEPDDPTITLITSVGTIITNRRITYRVRND